MDNSRVGHTAAAHLSRHLAIVDPAEGGEVSGLGTVEAMVEASVVAIGKGDHKLSFVLSYLSRQKERKKKNICIQYVNICI